MNWKLLHSVIVGAIMSLPAMAQPQADRGSFGDYLDNLKKESLAAGIPKTTVESAFAQLKLFKKAIASDKSQPESQHTLETYLPRVVPEWKVEQARSLFKQHRAELTAIGEKYGVQPRFIVALWGVESNFGALMGSYPVLSVTASLAYEGRREAFFKKEFLAALKIMAQENIPFEELKGSWAGAMGQTQFMPTSYLAYAQDGDGDGKKDIWSNPNDAFASAAYYLQQAGWQASETWGRQVQVPSSLDMSLVGLETKKSFAAWQALGVRRYDGKDLPNRDDMQVSVLMPDGQRGRKYLVYDNYRALMNWNRSDYFGISVTYLSERIKYPAID
ncbi:lytic murein transglycosylase [Shewanella salipaludis]|uniref:Lytic murein transglycosylase n=1 Tax=Shewanella salipaludis TaxID=2723052 RepID=A0A972JHL6_9GAMM|nr:lytic murein transglycosylase [Shewanella salipaludis]NMH64133.1 lytic murein transglycosylase [Shewanella salipaludis]